MHFLKADTQVVVRVGPAMAIADGVTPVTTLALTTADQAELLGPAGAATASISANTFAAITGVDGWYDLTLTAAQLAAEGMHTVVVQDASLNTPIFKDFMVVSANVFDSLFAAAGTDYLEVDTQQINGANVVGDGNATPWDGE